MKFNSTGNRARLVWDSGCGDVDLKWKALEPAEPTLDNYWSSMGCPAWDDPDSHHAMHRKSARAEVTGAIDEAAFHDDSGYVHLQWSKHTYFCEFGQ